VTVTGSLWILWLYDVCEEIDLAVLRQMLGIRELREVGARRPSPEQVRFERPPVVEQLDGKLKGELNYYEYGVISIKLQIPFEDEWSGLVSLAGRWITTPEQEAEAAEIVRGRVARVLPALIKPNETWLSEDYYIIHVADTFPPLSAAELIADHGKEIAAIVRGEQSELAGVEIDEILGSRLSYYPDDLLVVGWTAAFIHDTAEDAAPTIQLLEYANTQLLEFRYYDAVLSRLLAGVYRSLDRRSSWLTRWRMASQAEELNKIRLDIRVYRLAAQKVGVTDFRRLVDGKLATAGELYEFMMDQFHQSRAFVLEVLVVVILLIELAFLLRGKG
jgi:hypothetical protein